MTMPWPFEHVHDRRGIQSARAAQEQCALQQSHVGFGVEPVLALVRCGATRPSHLPRAQRRRRNSDASRHFADAQHALVRRASRNRIRDSLDEFFPLDTGGGFL